MKTLFLLLATLICAQGFVKEQENNNWYPFANEVGTITDAKVCGELDGLADIDYFLVDLEDIVSPKSSLFLPFGVEGYTSEVVRLYFFQLLNPNVGTAVYYIGTVEVSGYFNLKEIPAFYRQGSFETLLVRVSNGNGDYRFKTYLE